MAIQIIVDGYNLIGSERGLRGNLQQERQRLIARLQEYQKTKGYPVTVVFDGWRSGWVHEVAEKAAGITVIFSRQGEKADSVIMRLARELGSGCIVVTSDREVRRAAEGSGAVAIYAGEFHAKLRHFDQGVLESTEASIDQHTQLEVKTGNPRRLSKMERKRRERLRKL